MFTQLSRHPFFLGVCQFFWWLETIATRLELYNRCILSIQMTIFACHKQKIQKKKRLE